MSSAWLCPLQLHPESQTLIPLQAEEQCIAHLPLPNQRQDWWPFLMSIMMALRTVTAAAVAIRNCLTRMRLMIHLHD